MRYKETLSKHRRLAILRFLSDCPEYTTNASILTDVVNAMGIASSRDQISGELDWLKEQGFVDYHHHGAIIIATASARGIEIATGRAFHHGVQRPRAEP